MLTAKGEDMDKILGLEYGADDYMTKPFNILEVKARIKSIFRRSQPHGEAQEEHERIITRARSEGQLNRAAPWCSAASDVQPDGEGI